MDGLMGNADCSLIHFFAGFVKIIVISQLKIAISRKNRYPY
ncbi:hypothetical protein N644_2428 [Lactiplantibacillus paraplantarum]|nr:hypothetical protein N644_2428 [Lactiplantibacillus paraplantarum]